MKFLYIDDDLMDRKIFERTARVLDKHQWLFAPSFTVGLEMISKDSFDAIFIDGYLPDGNPDKLIGKTDLPIIVLSGADYDNSKGHFFTTCLKPLSESELIGIVEKLSRPKTGTELPSMKNLEGLAEGDVAFEIEMLEIYLNELPNEIEQLKAFVSNLDFENAGKLAHKMKSKIGLMAMNELREFAADIEKDCKNALNLESVPKRVEHLCIQLNYSLTFAQDELNKRL